MAHSAHASKPLRVLVSEGNSTSSREAITILGLLLIACGILPYDWGARLVLIAAGIAVVFGGIVAWFWPAPR